MKKIITLTLLFVAFAMSSFAEVLQCDTFVTDNGKKVVFTHIKHGSLAISCEGVEIQIDPVEKYPPVTDYEKMPKSDYIFITHEHSDHLDPKTVMTLCKDSTLVIANGNSAKHFGNSYVMHNGDKLALNDYIYVEAVPSYNTSVEKQRFHPKGRDNGYVLDIDGLRVYIAGDTEPIPEMKELKDIDIAFLPTNLPYTMTPEQTAEAARLFMPRVLYPYHYGETRIERVCEILKDSKVEVRIRNYK